MNEAPNTDMRITFFRTLYNVGTSDKARETIHGLLDGKITIPGVPLKQRDRWNLIASSSVALAIQGAGDLLAAERAARSDRGWPQVRLGFGGGRAALEARRNISPVTLAPAGVQEDWITASLPLFNRWDQTALTLPYLKPALDALPQMKRERKIFFVLNWLASFVEGQDSAEALRIVDNFLAANASDPDLKLKVLEVRDELARTVSIRRRSLLPAR